jgi:hypothetical protein
VASDPPLSSIDARQAFRADSVTAAGWDAITLTFDADVSGLTADDFTINHVGADRVGPTLDAVRHVGANKIRVELSGPMVPGSWMVISAGRSLARFGYLPGDVNSDGQVSGLDLLALIDALNGVITLPIHSVDIDRSGALDDNDVTRARMVINGDGPGERWLGRTLGPTSKDDQGTEGVPQEGNAPELEVTLVPHYDGPGGACAPPASETLVDVILSRVNAGDDIMVRGLQVDTKDTDPALKPLGLSILQNNIAFWSFATQAACVALPALCGTEHFIVDELAANELLSVTFIGKAPSATTQLVIPGDGSDYLAGQLVITAPASGSFKIDVVNPDETDVNDGFYLVFGFGVEPGDPVTTWRANTGEVTGGTVSFVVCEDGEPCVPAECDDDDVCNGVETCVEDVCTPGTPLVCDDELFCNGLETCDPSDGCQAGTPPCAEPTPICNEETNQCGDCMTNDDCDPGEVCIDNLCGTGCDSDDDCLDANLCNGTETCDETSGNCLPGTPLVCNDGLFCNGVETCDPATGCVAGTPPCTGAQTCNEDTNMCETGGCTSDDECDDDLVCNGTETCNEASGECVPGTPVVCDPGQICTEPGGECQDTDNKISLVPDQDCYFWGEVVTVDITVVADQNIVGGQFFIAYDSAALDFFSAVPGDPWSIEIFESVSEAQGFIDYAVHVPFNPPHPGASSGTMATLTFMALQDFCGPTEIVWRETTNPPTRLTNTGGDEILPACNDATITLIDPTPGECPGDVEVNADAGTCTAHVCFKDPMNGGCPDGSAGAGGPSCVATNAAGGSIPLDAENCGDYPAGANTVVCGGNGSDCDGGFGCEFTITVSENNTLTSVVQLSPIVSAVGFDRCITMEVFPDDCGDPVVISETLTFGPPGNIRGHGRFEGKIPCGDYMCVTGRDRLHTLRSVGEAEIVEEELDIPNYNITRLVYFVEFKGDPQVGGNWLTGGNLNDDCVIDILDFGVFIDQFGDDVGADTDCSTMAPHSDVSGDGLVNEADYNFIANNFLELGKENCCGEVAPGCLPPGGGGRAGSALIIDNKGRVLSVPATSPQLQRADLNGDGVLDLADLDAFEAGVRPAPKAKVRSRVEDGRR